MPPADNASALNLSGMWRGLYNYPRAQPSVHFTADLAETDSWLVGMTEETASAGDVRGCKISATLQGRRSGASVTWLKLYDGSSRNYDSVHYTGVVNADGTEIEGRWTIPGIWSGTFLMIRSRGAVLATARETTEQI
jgi:hypothetical protein